MATIAIADGSTSGQTTLSVGQVPPGQYQFDATLGSQTLSATLTRSSRRVRSAENAAQHREPIAGDPVIRPVAPLLALDQARLTQDAQVVADGRLAQAERIGQVALARLAARLRLDQAEQPEARRVGNHLEGGRQALGFGRVDHLLQDRRARGCCLDRGDGLHPSILTHVYVDVHTPI